MVTIQQFRELALSFPEAVEEPHFENIAFKVRKKIFATLTEKEQKGCLKFSKLEQSSFTIHDIIYPIPNKWGLLGWSNVNLKKIKKEMLIDAMTTAYCEVAPKKLSAPYIEARNKII